MSKGQRAGLEAKAGVTSGFVSTGSTNLGLETSLSVRCPELGP